MQLLRKKDSPADLSVPGYKPRIQKSEYEKKQEVVKEQIMATQRKSVQLHTLEKKYLTQSAAAVGASVGLVLLFIFILFPTMIRFAGNLKGFSVLKSDTIPPRIPVFAAPPLATQESSVSLSGFAEAKSTIVLVKNGQESERVQANDSGEYTLTLNLDDGDNTFTMYSIDEAENESNVSKPFVIKKDNEAPELTIEAPENDRTITNTRERDVEVKGKVNETAKVFLNDSFVSVDGDGNFSTTYTLNEGANELTIKAVDQAENTTEEKRTVTFKP
jgi:hypothetical protein